MAVAVKASPLGTSLSTSSSTTLAIAHTGIEIGDFIVVRIATDNLSATTPTFTCADGSANVYTLQRQGAVNATAAAGVAGAIFTCKATVARPAGGITVTLSGAVAHKAGYLESFTGVENTVRSAAVGATGTATAASAGASGTVNAGDLVLGFLANETRGAITGDTDTTNGSWSAIVQQRSATSGSDATCVSVAGQYKIATASGAQTYNVTAVGAEWLCQCVVMQASPEPTITQAAYRWFDEGTESGAVALANQDTAVTGDITNGDATGTLRIRLQSTTAVTVSATDDWQLQWEKNASGTWMNVVPSGETTFDSFTDTGGGMTARYITSNSNGDSFGLGQSFSGSLTLLTKAMFWLRKGNAPTGNLTASIYPHTGTFGTTGRPMGGTGTGPAPLLTSNPVAVSTVSTTAGWVTFTFPDTGFRLTSGTPYFLVVEGVPQGAANYIESYYKIGVHAGNVTMHLYDATPSNIWWNYSSTEDMPFQLFASASTVFPYDSSNLTNGQATTNRLTGGTGTFTAGKVSEDAVMDDLGWAGNNYTELVYALKIEAAPLVNGDTLRFRVLRNGATTNMTYTVTPTINLIKTEIPPQTWDNGSTGGIGVAGQSGTGTVGPAPQTWIDGSIGAFGVAGQSDTWSTTLPSQIWIGTDGWAGVTGESALFVPGDITWTGGSTATSGVSGISGALVGGATTWTGSTATAGVAGLSAAFVAGAGPSTWTGSIATAGVAGQSGLFTSTYYWPGSIVDDFDGPAGTSLLTRGYGRLFWQPSLLLDGNGNAVSQVVGTPENPDDWGWAGNVNLTPIENDSSVELTFNLDTVVDYDVELGFRWPSGVPQAMQNYLCYVAHDAHNDYTAPGVALFRQSTRITSVPFTFAAGQDYALQVRFTGGDIRVLVDGVAILTWTDPTPLVGNYVSIYSDWNYEGTADLFRSLRAGVTASIGIAGQSGSFSLAGGGPQTWDGSTATVGVAVQSGAISPGTTIWSTGFRPLPALINDTFTGTAGTPLDSVGWVYDEWTSMSVLDGVGNAVPSVMGDGGAVHPLPIPDNNCWVETALWVGDVDFFLYVEIRMPNPVWYHGYNLKIESSAIRLMRDDTTVGEAWLPLFVQRNVSHTLRIEAWGNRFLGSLDGRKIIDWTDPAPLTDPTIVGPYTGFSGYEDAPGALKVESYKAGELTAEATIGVTGISGSFVAAAVPAGVDERALESGAARVSEDATPRQLELAGPPLTWTGSDVNFGVAGESGAFTVPAPFNPLSLNWYAAYWASDPSWTPPADGAGVADWRNAGTDSIDPTHVNALMATTTRQPIYRAAFAALNGKPALQFDGVDDYMLSDTVVSVPQPNHICVVGWLDPTHSATATILDGTATARHMLRNLGASGAQLAAATAVTVAGAGAVGPFVMTALFNTTSSQIRTNGLAFTLPSTVGIHADVDIRIGSDSTYVNPYKGAIAFIGISDAILTEQQVNDLETWAKDFYSVPVVPATKWEGSVATIGVQSGVTESWSWTGGPLTLRTLGVEGISGEFKDSLWWNFTAREYQSIGVTAVSSEFNSAAPLDFIAQPSNYFTGIPGTVSTPDPGLLPDQYHIIARLRGPAARETALASYWTIAAQWEDGDIRWAWQRERNPVSSRLTEQVRNSANGARSYTTANWLGDDRNQDHLVLITSNGLYGGGNEEVLHSWSLDSGASWMPLGTVNPSIGTLWRPVGGNTACLVRIGGHRPQNYNQFDGRIYWVEAREGLIPGQGKLIWRYHSDDVPPRTELEFPLTVDDDADGIVNGWHRYESVAYPTGTLTFEGGMQRFTAPCPSGANTNFGIESDSTFPCVAGQQVGFRGVPWRRDAISTGLIGYLSVVPYNSVGTPLTAVSPRMDPLLATTYNPTVPRGGLVGALPVGTVSARLRYFVQANTNSPAGTHIIDLQSITLTLSSSSSLTYTDPRGRPWTLQTPASFLLTPLEFQGSTVTIGVAGQSSTFTSESTWTGSTATVGVEGISNEWITALIFIGSTATVGVTGVSTAFLPGAVTLPGSIATVGVAGLSGTMVPGPATWTGSLASVGVFTETGIWFAGQALEGSLTEIGIRGISGTWTGGPTTWTGGSTATAGVAGQSNVFIAAPATWIGSTATFGTSTQSGAFLGGAVTWVGGSTAAIGVLSITGSFSSVYPWNGTTATAGVAGISGVLLGGPTTWAGSEAGIGISGTSALFLPGARTWTGSSSSAGVAGISGVLLGGPTTWGGSTATFGFATVSGVFTSFVVWLGSTASLGVDGQSDLYTPGETTWPSASLAQMGVAGQSGILRLSGFQAYWNGWPVMNAQYGDKLVFDWMLTPSTRTGRSAGWQAVPVKG